MSVRVRLALATACALLVLLLTFYIGGRLILLNTFHMVEQEVLRGIPSMVKAMHGELQQLDEVAAEWIREKPVVEALQQNDASFARRAYSTSELMRDGVSLVALAAPDGRLLAALFRPAGEGAEPVAASRSLQEHLTAGSPLLDFQNQPRSLRTGMVLLEEGPMLVAAHRIPGETNMPMKGVLLLGRPLQDESVMQRLSAALPGLRLGQHHRRLSLRPVSNGETVGRPNDIMRPKAEMTAGGNGLGGYEALMPVYDIYGRHALSLVISLPASFTSMAETSLAWLSLFVALVGILAIAPLLVLQGHAVLNPLSRLATEIRALQERKATGRRLHWMRQDEFGVVARAVDGMLDAIDDEHRRIEESEGRNRALVETNPDLLFLLDRKGQILDVRVPPGAEATFPQPLPTVVGSSLAGTRQMPADVSDRFMERLTTAFETRQLQTMEFHVVRPDGQDFWGEVRIVRIDDSRALVIERNMSDRYKAERGRRLLEVRIGQKQKMESLGLLASGIAHDFNNVLAAILGHAESAAASLPPDSPAEEALVSIRSAAVRASGLTKQLQSYAGQGAFELQSVNLNHLLGDMAQLLRSSLSKKATLEMSFDADLPLIEGDTSQIWQVAMNLLLNASEALDGKPGSITLATRALEATAADLSEFLCVKPLTSGRYAMLEVSDTGHGMTHEVQARIFDPFFSTKAKGRGLGLSAVVGIVQAHGGGIAVRSAPGAGTTFRIALPASTRQVQDPPTAGAVEPPAAAEGQLILVAEDNPDIRKVTVLALRGAGYDVLAAENGKVAVEMFAHRAQQVWLVLMDVEMPEMNGEEAFRAMRAIRCDVPVVVMTGYGDVSAHERFSSLNPAGILAKPFTRDQLLGMLGRLAAAKGGAVVS